LCSPAQSAPGTWSTTWATSQVRQLGQGILSPRLLWAVTYMERLAPCGAGTPPAAAPAAAAGTFIPVNVTALRHLMELLEATSTRPTPPAGDVAVYDGGEGTVGGAVGGAFGSAGRTASTGTAWTRCASPSRFPAVPPVVYINTEPQQCPDPARFTPVCTKAWLEKRDSTALRGPRVKLAPRPAGRPSNGSRRLPPGARQPPGARRPPAARLPPGAQQPPAARLPPGTRLPPSVAPRNTSLPAPPPFGPQPFLALPPPPPTISAPGPPPPSSSCRLTSCTQGASVVEVYACDSPVVPPPGMVPLQVEQGTCSWGWPLASPPPGRGEAWPGPMPLYGRGGTPAGPGWQYSSSPPGAWTPPLYGRGGTPAGPGWQYSSSPPGAWTLPLYGRGGTPAGPGWQYSSSPPGAWTLPLYGRGGTPAGPGWQYSGSPAAGAWTPPLYGGAAAAGRQGPPGQGPAAGAEGCRLVDSCQLNIPGFNDGTHRAQVYICDQPVRLQGSQQVEAMPAAGC
jgi:hypothetical protein